jgi:hypothetical protein
MEVVLKASTIISRGFYIIVDEVKAFGHQKSLVNRFRIRVEEQVCAGEAIVPGCMLKV